MEDMTQPAIQSPPRARQVVERRYLTKIEAGLELQSQLQKTMLRL